MDFLKWFQKKRIRFPGWLFVAAMAVFCELILHIWSNLEIQPGRLAAVLVFSLGFGCLLALICSFFRGKGEKIAALVISFLLVVLYITEYFMIDAYKNYMSLDTMFSRAGDVAGDFMPTVLQLLGQSVGRIAFMLLPLVLYGIFARPGRTGWKVRGILAGAMVVLYLLGYGVVQLVGSDADRFSKTYNFDSAVRSFGLNVGLGLDLFQSSGETLDGDFFTEMTLPEEEETEPVQEETPEASESTEPTEPPVVYEPHSYDLDFAALAESETNAQISAIHSYIASLEPAMENEYTGMFEGMNLIFITAEAFSSEVIDPERTPTLYRMANEGIQFTDYYQPAWGASTTSGEFSNLFGLMPINGGGCMRETLDQDLFLTLGKQFQKLGYSTTGYHNHDFTYYNRKQTHAAIGLDQFIGVGNGMEEGVQKVSPESDLEMIDFTIPKHVDGEPFYLYYITMSGHAPYVYRQQAMARKNYAVVENMEASDAVKCYLAANMELEYAMQSLINQLEAAGIADNTVVVLATDHYPYALERSAAWGTEKNALAELYGQAVTDCFIRDHSTLIIWSGCLEGQNIVVDDPVYSLDLPPTLSNLFGLEYDSRLLVGRDVFSDELPVVFWPTYSWKTDKGSFNSDTDVFTPAEGETVDEEYVAYVSSLVSNKIKFSKTVQNNNYYDALLKILNAQQE